MIPKPQDKAPTREPYGTVVHPIPNMIGGVYQNPQISMTSATKGDSQYRIFDNNNYQVRINPQKSANKTGQTITKPQHPIVSQIQTSVAQLQPALVRPMNEFEKHFTGSSMYAIQAQQHKIAENYRKEMQDYYMQVHRHLSKENPSPDLIPYPPPIGQRFKVPQKPRQTKHPQPIQTILDNQTFPRGIIT